MLLNQLSLIPFGSGKQLLLHIPIINTNKVHRFNKNGFFVLFMCSSIICMWNTCVQVPLEASIKSCETGITDRCEPPDMTAEHGFSARATRFLTTERLSCPSYLNVCSLLYLIPLLQFHMPVHAFSLFLLLLYLTLADIRFLLRAFLTTKLRSWGWLASSPFGDPEKSSSKIDCPLMRHR